MQKLAITGNVGSGKSSLGALLRGWGYVVLDADVHARQILNHQQVREQVVQLLGAESFDSQGNYNRSWVRNLVFAQPELRVRLEQIMHPEIRSLFEKQCVELSKFSEKIWVFYEIPLLFETNRETDFDAVITVVAPDSVRLERIVSTRGLSKLEAEAMMKAQLSQAEKAARSDYVLENDASVQDLDIKLQSTLKDLRDRFSR